MQIGKEILRRKKIIMWESSERYLTSSRILKRIEGRGGGYVCLTSYRTGGWVRGWGRSRERGGKIINHGWDFIKLRLSCAQRIVYYLLLRGGFAQLGNTPGTVVCFELACASRSPRWSSCVCCRSCLRVASKTSTVFPKIENHRRDSLRRDRARHL